MNDIFAPDQVNYILRLYLPHWQYDERIEEIVRFCKETDTRHVMLFSDAQFLVWNQLSHAEAEREVATMAKAGAHLAQEKIRFGINATYNMRCSAADQRGHLDYDHWATFADGTCDFRTPCNLDPKLDRYLDWFYRLMAGTRPDYIYVDDDHRFMLDNMRGTWGCQCDLHLKKFSELTGRNWTREELNYALRNEPAVRAAWIDFLGRRLVELGGVMERAVHRASPETKLGMMVPCVHALPNVGHTVENVLAAFHPGPGRPLVRPCIGPYQDFNRRLIIPGLFYLEHLRHLLGDSVEYTPEIENCPNTRLAKSMAIIRFSILQGLLNRMNNPALTVCGYAGESPYFDPAYAAMLKQYRPYFETLRKQAPLPGTRKGVQFIWDMASTKATNRKVSQPLDLYWPSFAAHAVTGNLGISHTYDESPVRFLAGESVRCLPPARIDEILSHGVLLDAYAAKALVEMGYADAIGCTVGDPLYPVAGEKVTDPEFGGPYAGYYIHYVGGRDDRAFRLNPAAGARELSEMIDHDLTRIAPGMILFENRRGGRVAVLPYFIHPADLAEGHLVCYQRRHIFKAVFDWMQPDLFPVWVEDPTDFSVQTWREDKRLFCCLTNLSYDVAEEITVLLKVPGASPEQAFYLAPTGKKRKLPVVKCESAGEPDAARWQIRLSTPAFYPLIFWVDC